MAGVGSLGLGSRQVQAAYDWVQKLVLMTRCQGVYVVTLRPKGPITSEGLAAMAAAAGLVSTKLKDHQVQLQDPTREFLFDALDEVGEAKIDMGLASVWKPGELLAEANRRGISVKASGSVLTLTKPRIRALNPERR